MRLPRNHVLVAVSRLLKDIRLLDQMFAIFELMLILGLEFGCRLKASLPLLLPHMSEHSC